jgi:SpoVK/Ycf46/Vps4 family AAA+-type ATPase
MERRIVAQLLTCMDELNHPTRAEDSLPGAQTTRTRLRADEVARDHSPAGCERRRRS